MKRLLCFALAATFPAYVAAQTYITAGDNSLTLTQLLHGHPEGMVLCLPSAQGRSLGAAMRSLMDQEPMLELQLQEQDLSLEQRLGRELQRIKGWGSEKPYWALIGADRQIYAAGSEVPTSAALHEVYRQSPLHSRADTLREFLKANPGHREAQAQLVLELRTLAERRTEQALPAPADAKEGAPPPAPLNAEQDARIWGEYAERYERFMSDGAWLSPDTDVSPLPLAAQLSAMAERSPSLRDLAARLLPEVETHLRDKLTDERRWNVWLSLRAAGGHGRASAVLVGARPLPGALRWPPAAAVNAFVEDARESGDWREAEAVLQASFDQNEDLLQAMAAAAREDAGGHGSTKVEMGAYFGFAQWNGEVALLVEAKLRNGKLQEADRLFRAVYARVPRPVFLEQAADLARRCGAEGLAEQWAALGK